MPIGIYKHHSHQGFQKGHTIWKGRHHTLKTKKKLSKIHQGKHYPKLSEAKKGKKHHNWKGGKIKSRNRWFIWKPDHPFADSKGYVRQSRLIAEKYLGRYLIQKEVVHHINGNTLDDRPENLFIFPSNYQHLKNKSILQSNLFTS